VLVQALCDPGFDPAVVPPTLVVVAHPDDETVGAGSRLPRLRQALFVYVTDGAPQDGRDAARHGLSVDGYREVRRRERAAALGLAGIGAGQVQELGCPDQQAAFQLPELALRLAALLRVHSPMSVLTHPYEGGHPDHDATAFAVHAAAALLRRQGVAAPAIVEMSSYHQGPQGLRAGVFLPQDADAGAVQLDAADRNFKRALLDCYATQRETLAQFPLEVERFRTAPRYDFLAPPHAGALFYEAHGWGITGEQFRAQAREAGSRLGLGDPPWH
jgi:LmbE family N-acetylglucosaminyl deacetylase